MSRFSVITSLILDVISFGGAASTRTRVVFRPSRIEVVSIMIATKIAANGSTTAYPNLAATKPRSTAAEL